MNSMETMERKIKEFERYANIEIPEFLTEEGPTKTHLIMNSHRLATFQDIKKEVTNVKQAQSAVKARSGDVMDVDAFTKGSKGAPEGSGKKTGLRSSVLVLEKSSSFRLSQEAKGQRQ